MKNTKIIFLSLLISLIAFTANCKKNDPGGNQTNGILMSSIFGGLGKGNCAISINMGAFALGQYLNLAVNNTVALSGANNAQVTGGWNAYLAAVNSAASTAGTAQLNLANSETSDTFTQRAYETVTGSTVTEQGYASYAAVPYGRKFDAFFGSAPASITNGWSAAKRAAILFHAKQFMNAFTIMSSYNGSYTANNTTVLTDSYTKTAAQQAGVNGLFAQLGCSLNSFVNATCGQIANGASITFALHNFEQSNGVGVLTCAKIPAASCSSSGLLTANRAADITGQVRVHEAIANNQDCSKPSTAFMEGVRRALFIGLPDSQLSSTGQSNVLGTTAITVSGLNGAPNWYNGRYRTTSSAVGFVSTEKILPENAYPKFGRLVSLGFGSLMPMNAGSIDQAYYASPTAFGFGTNLKTTVVDSCESIGLGVGLLPNLANATTTGTGANGSVAAKNLSSPQEIVYAFSDNGLAAAQYAALIGLSSSVDGDWLFTGPTTNQAIACNNSFRKATTIPAVVGGTVPVLADATSGDGNATSTLSVCLYGGNSTARTALAANLNAGFTTTLGFTVSTANGLGVANCPLAVRAASAAKYWTGDTGLKSEKSTWPDGN
ncbi:MAG: hypothetical protein K8R21_02620 [Leptospira sp.]|nr:hypothetical protein [Leptospira sp.]